jgi:hypothetical protein
MRHRATEYEARAEECIRLAGLTDDEMLAEQILALGRSYLEFAAYLRPQEGRRSRRTAEIIRDVDWHKSREPNTKERDEVSPAVCC